MSVFSLVSRQDRIYVCGGPEQDHYQRPLPTLKCYNLHALTIVIIHRVRKKWTNNILDMKRVTGSTCCS